MRSRTLWRCSMAMMAAALLAPVAAAQYTHVELEPVDATYTTGYLVWSNGQGGISWSASTATDDPAGPLDPTRSPAALAVWTVSGLGGTQPPATATQTLSFYSDPLAADHHLNVSRLVQVDLFVPTTQNCDSVPAPSVELYLDGSLFAGALDETTWKSGNPWLAEPPAGHCQILYRMHSEVDVLPKSARIELRIVYHARYFNEAVYEWSQQYGTKGDHRSVIRFSDYSADDLILRTTKPPTTTEESGGESAAAFVVLALAPAAGWRRGRGLAALASLMILAGCAGPASRSNRASDPTDAGLSGSASFSIQPTGDPNAPTGSLLGIISDEDASAVAGASVTLLSTPNFTRSDEFGRFRFDGVPAGTYVLRIDGSIYHSLETSVRIDAGRLTTIEIQLRFSVPPEQRRHPHDYWNGRTVIDWFERDVSINGASLGSAKWCGSQPLLTRSFCSGYVELPPAATDGSGLVLPGTYDIEVTLTWDIVENPVAWAGIVFQANDDPGYLHGGDGPLILNETPLYPRASGSTFHIRANWEMDDVGHQTFSMWRFQVYVPQEGNGLTVLQGPFHVAFRLHKGVVPLGPAHRDHWQGATVLTIMDQSEIKTECPGTGGGCARARYPDYWARWIPGRLIPPDTARISIVLEQDKATAPTPIDFGLIYRAGNVPPPVDGNDFTNFKPIEATKTAGLRKEYELVLAAPETDPFYAKRSNWEFALDDGKESSTTVVNGPIGSKLSITAYKTTASGGAKEDLPLFLL